MVINRYIVSRALCAVAAALSFLQLATAAESIPIQSVDASLRARLPKEILASGELISVNSGSFPPYEIVTDTRSVEGASADLFAALGQLLGIKIRHETVSGLSGVLSGIKAGRYQLAMGPVGDFPERQRSNDFVDYVQEHVVFAVQKGNPLRINSIEDTCGKRVAVMAGGSAERVIKHHSTVCATSGKSAVEVQSYGDQATATLAVRTNRADAFFSSQASLAWYLQKTNGALVLAGSGSKNGFPDLFQGAVLPKGSPLSEVFRDGLKVLFTNGTYGRILKKWGVEGNAISVPGINLAKADAE